MNRKDISFPLIKQAAYIEFELEGMEKSFRYMLDNFGDEAARNLFSEKRPLYQKFNAIRESLDRLAMLQENLERAGEGLFDMLSNGPLSEAEILDAIIDFNSKRTKR